MNWPNDSDGDALRRLEESDFDFSKNYDVDFNIDFNNWPPSQEAIEILNKEYGGVEVYDPEDEYEGYLMFKINSLITYNLVVDTQSRVSILMKPYGGTCETWGVLH